MTEDHLITPSPELVLAWSGFKPLKDSIRQNWIDIATQAAHWGADQELEACCEWLVRNYNYPEAANPLRAARRPEPERPTRRQLMMLADDMGMTSVGDAAKYAQAVLARWGNRRALEQLDD